MPPPKAKEPTSIEKYRARQKALAATPPGPGRIPVNFDPTEFEIQAYLYHALASLGYTVRGEVTTRCGTCRFDLVAYYCGSPVRIIEVKKGKGRHPNPGALQRKREKQLARYRVFGVPVDGVFSLSKAREYVERTRLNPFVNVM